MISRRALPNPRKLIHCRRDIAQIVTATFRCSELAELAFHRAFRFVLIFHFANPDHDRDKNRKAM